MNDETLHTAVQDGITAADTEGDPTEAARLAAERQQVTTWLAELKAAREFDEAIRKGYARDRRYAKGDSGFEVSVPLIAGAIDTIVSFVYAKDPDVDAVPSQMVEAPKDPMPRAPEPPQGLQALMADPTAALAQSGGDIEGAAVKAGYDLAREQAEYQQAMAEYEAQLAAYHQEQAERRRRKIELALFAQTLEVVISKLWRKARLKRRARKAVRSALTTGIGWVKVTWQERTQRDPLVAQQINDLKDSLAHLARQMEALEDDPQSAEEAEAQRLSIQQQIDGLAEKLEIPVARGLAIDFVASENMQVAPGVEIMEYLDAPWLNEKIFMTIADAATRWPDVELKKLRKATRYNRKKPKESEEAPEAGVEAGDADQYTTGNESNGKPCDSDYICINEKWSLDDGLIYRTAEGLDFWLDEPAPPNIASPRFYGYFPLAFFEVDGERSPQSLPHRTWKLENEYNRTRTAFAEMRRRNYPGVIFDEGDIEPGYADRLSSNSRQELIGVKTVSGRPVGDCFAPKPVSGIDPAMVDTTPVIRDFDRTSGTQEALQGTVESAKTATEAEIQATGFQSRSGTMKDALEDWLGEIARYTAMIAVQALDPDDVLKLAGPDAIWPNLETPEELETLIDVDIRAGSSGKPNTRSEREAWQVVLPILQNAIAQVGQLRGSDPSEIADKVEALVETTFDVMGERVDISRYLPQHEGMAVAATPPMQPAAPGAPVEEPPTPGMSPAAAEMMQ